MFVLWSVGEGIGEKGQLEEADILRFLHIYFRLFVCLFFLFLRMMYMARRTVLVSSRVTI